METKEEIIYSSFPYGVIAIIPKGTKVIEATNLSDPNQFWVENWEGMTDQAKSWAQNYGFLVQLEEVK